jgi:hypothetical protein
MTPRRAVERAGKARVFAAVDVRLRPGKSKWIPGSVRNEAANSPGLRRQDAEATVGVADGP